MPRCRYACNTSAYMTRPYSTLTDPNRPYPPLHCHAESNPSVRYRGRTRRVATAVNGSSGQ